jgi:2-polyprenyl-3-methyl-5-hydroxy-6-metoxy-1,4-benzoquinol methylase
MPIRTTDGQLQATVMMVWREYILHDEIMSALSFLENAPYRIRHTPLIEATLRRTRQMLEWMDDKRKQNAGNTPMDPNGHPLSHEITNALPGPLTGAVEMRFRWICDRLQPSQSIIDFGCIDGTMTNRWGMKGHPVTGVDLSTNSVNLANSKAHEFKTGARHINAYFKDAPDKVVRGSYDVATCSDVYEHLKDPVNDLLVHARKCVNGCGRMLLVTPHGSWGRGYFKADWAPWKWHREHGSWLAAQPRGHLVAPTVWSVAAHFREAGWWVKTSGIFLQEVPDVPGQGNVCVEALATAPPSYPGLDIVVYTGAEITAPSVRLGAALALLGNRVRHYARWPQEGIADFVDRIQAEKVRDIECDVFITDEDNVVNPLGAFKVKANRTAMSLAGLDAHSVHDVLH